MRRTCTLAGLMAGLFWFACSATAGAQADATANRGVEIAAFGGLTGNYTGLRGGRNLDLTAGIDFTFRPIGPLYLSLEGRGLYPLDSGVIDRQKNVLGGVKVSEHFGRIHPYGDVLFGRGAIEYNALFLTPDGQSHYIRSVSDVIAAGGGIDVGMSPHLLFKVDGQFERYSTPATSSGHLFSKPITAALAYRFNFGRF